MGFHGRGIAAVQAAHAGLSCPGSTKVACATPGMLSLPASPHIVKAYPILASAEALSKRSGHRQLRTHAQATRSCALVHEIESFRYRCILLALHLGESSLRKMSWLFMMSQSAVVVNSCLTPGAARSGCIQASSCQATSPSERRACSSIPPAPAPVVPETRLGAQTQQLVCLQWTRQLAAHVESASPCFQTSCLGKTQSRLGTYMWT